jgi:hypothetical protein
MEAGLSNDQQKGEKFNKGHFVVEQIKIELNFLLTTLFFSRELLNAS